MGVLASIPSLLKKPLFTGERVIAVDVGSHSMRAALVQVQKGKARIIHSISIVPEEEGLKTASQKRARLLEAVQGLGDFPIVVCLPQNAALSQILDVASYSSINEQSAIQERVEELGGLSGSRMVTAHARLTPFESYLAPCWVSFCQEEEALSRITTLGLEPEDLCGLVTQADALIAAAISSEIPESFILCDIGHNETTVVLFQESQGVYTATLPIGGSHFSKSLASGLKITLHEAEDLKRQRGIVDRSKESLLSVSADWEKSLERIIKDWATDHPAFNKIEPQALPVVLTGNGALLGGWPEHLKSSLGTDISVIAEHEGMPALTGAALHATSQKEQNTLLLPDQVASAIDKETSWHWLQAMCLLLLLAASIAMAATSSFLNEQIEKDIAAQELTYSVVTRIRNAEEARREVLNDHHFYQPLLAAQHQTVDYLDALNHLENKAINPAWWYVQISDQQSYFSHTNTTEIVQSGEPIIDSTAAYGLVAEVCMVKEEDNMREDLSILVSTMGNITGVFRVDTISDHLNHTKALSTVLQTNRHFALSIELFPHAYHVAPSDRNPSPDSTLVPQANASLSREENP